MKKDASSDKPSQVSRISILITAAVVLFLFAAGVTIFYVAVSPPAYDGTCTSFSGGPVPCTQQEYLQNYIFWHIAVILCLSPIAVVVLVIVLTVLLWNDRG